MKRYNAWRETLSEPRKMLVDLLVNCLAAAILYLLYVMIFEDGKVNISKLTLGSLIFSLFMTRSLKWRNIKALFRPESE
jgi:branched-subunit amino acid transport protein AzlD